VGEETAGPASSTVTEVRGPVAVILDLRWSSRSGGKKDGGGADPLQEGSRRLQRARRRRREKRRRQRPALAALRPGGGLARPLPEPRTAWMGGRRPGLVDGDMCGGRWRPHPRSAPEARLRWQLVKRRGGSTTGSRSAALDGEEEAGSGGGGTGGAAGLLWLRCGWGAAVRVGNPNRHFLYRGSAGCWARRPHRLLGQAAGPTCWTAMANARPARPQLARRAHGPEVGRTTAKACRPAGPSAATTCLLMGQEAAPG
jgi:hypothetical protein